MEFLTFLAVPVLTSLFAPVVLEYIGYRINKKKEAASQAHSNEHHNDEIASQLRQELRDENLVLKERNEALEQKVQDGSAVVLESERWRARYYAMKKEKQHLEFELTLIRKELEYLREYYDEFVQVRNKAEQRRREINGN